MKNDLENFFNPKGVVVIGASSDPTKLGYSVSRNLLTGGYAGAVHLVNPKGEMLFEKPLYPSVANVADPVDLAIVIVPAAAAPKALTEVGKRGIKAAILTSGGFKETGSAGAALEEEVKQICRDFGIRLIGPNCIGLLDTHLPIDTTFLPPPPPRAGKIAFLSHSGAFCAAVIDWSRRQSFGFSRLISLGNQADITETDLLLPIAEDPNTKVITLYIESLPDGKRFIVEAQKASRLKPIIALKVGRTSAGQKAAASHTGALAGAENAYNAAFEKSGVLRATSAEEMFDWAQALSDCPLPAGRRVAILTNAGGPGVIAADALGDNNLELAALQAETIKKLQAHLPAAASALNPVDMLASASAEQYARSLELLLADKGVDTVMVIVPPSPNHPTEDIADALISVLKSSPKPVLINLMGAELIQVAATRFQSADVPVFSFPERTASALGALAQRADYLKRASASQTTRDFSPELIAKQATDTEALIAAYGIPTVPMKLAENASEAAELASTLGFPLVMKIASPGILHKSDIGGVFLNIQTADEVKEKFTLAMQNAREKRPQAKIEGVHLQKQIGAGQEVILGAVRDSQFGALMMFGSGGVEVEGLKDIAFGLAPLSQNEAKEMISRTWAGQKLKGFRSIPPADIQSVTDALVRLSWLVFDYPEIEEIEINPLRALSEGVAAIDVRATHRAD